MGIGSQAWDRLFGAPRPKELHPFREINGVHHAPATPGDLLFHLRAERMDLCFELSTLIMARLEGAVTVADTAQGSSISTTATCSASSTARKTRWPRPRATPR